MWLNLSIGKRAGLILSILSKSCFKQVPKCDKSYYQHIKLHKFYQHRKLAEFAWKNWSNPVRRHPKCKNGLLYELIGNSIWLMAKLWKVSLTQFFDRDKIIEWLCQEVNIKVIIFLTTTRNWILICLLIHD